MSTAAGSTYALGKVVWQHGQTFKNNNTDAIDDTMTRFDYVWWDNAVQSGVTYDKHYGYGNNNGSSGTFTLGNFNNNFMTTYSLNGIGQLTSANVNDGVPKTIGYTLDANGQVIRRNESRNSLPGGPAPRELFYRFAGKQLGMTGNNGTADVSYAASPAITSSYADFSQSLEPYNSNAQGRITVTGITMTVHLIHVAFRRYHSFCGLPPHHQNLAM